MERNKQVHYFKLDFLQKSLKGKKKFCEDILSFIVHINISNQKGRGILSKLNYKF